MPSGWAVIAETQIMVGYCLLLPDPVVPHLNAMDRLHQELFLRDMALLGDAVLEVTGAVRINYEMLGNLEPALHAHIIPRYDDQSDPLRTKPIWLYDWTRGEAFSEEQHGGLLRSIRTVLKGLRGDCTS